MCIEQVPNDQALLQNVVIQFLLLMLFVAARIDDGGLFGFVKHHIRVFGKRIKYKWLDVDHQSKSKAFFIEFVGWPRYLYFWRLTKIIIQHIDYIIVGQGLAGSCLALNLIKAGKSVRVFDNPRNNHCSNVAAGLFNPITGKVLAQTWHARQLFDTLFEFYEQMEVELNGKFFFPQPIYRPFLSVAEQNDWMARSADLSMQGVIEEIITSSRFPQCQNPFGGILLKRCGFLNVPLFLEKTRQFLRQHNAYEETIIDPAEMRYLTDQILYREITAKAIIYCTGVEIRNHPLFSWLPIKPLKGETLTINLSESPEVIFNRGVYIVPASGQTYHVGATYKPGDSTVGITTAGLEELTLKLDELLTVSYQISQQNWGIRPSTPDRKPILGSHFVHKNVVVFNGLGTKGVSQAPYFAQQLCHWLLGRGEIQNEVNIERFKALYSKSLV